MDNRWHRVLPPVRHFGVRLSVLVGLAACSGGGSSPSRDASADSNADGSRDVSTDGMYDASADSSTYVEAGAEGAVRNDAQGVDGPIEGADGRDAVSDALFAKDSTEEASLDAPLGLGDAEVVSDAIADAEPVDDSGPVCMTHVTTYLAPVWTKSVSFGADEAYYAGMAVSCDVGGVNACVSACINAGGASAWCGEAKCSPDTHLCAPPACWLGANRVGREDDIAASIAVSQFEYQDTMVVTGFGAQLSLDAKVTGLSLEVRRKADDPTTSDLVVQPWFNGQLAGSNRAKTAVWPTTFGYGYYGGQNDLWGRLWTSADVMSAEFGFAIKVKSTATSSGHTASIDYIRMKIFYQMPDCK